MNPLTSAVLQLANQHVALHVAMLVYARHCGGVERATRIHVRDIRNEISCYTALIRACAVRQMYGERRDGGTDAHGIVEERKLE